MTVLASIDVVPLYGQVCLLDAAWPEYPQWESGDEAVVHGPPGPDEGPHQGFAVGTRSDVVDGAVCTVRVDVVDGAEPSGMHLAFRGALAVGATGVVVGNSFAGLTPVEIPGGEYALDIWVDSSTPASVGHVVFALHSRAR